MSAAVSEAERPLASPMFRALWIATIVSNVGTWMHDVGAGWLMTSLSPDPLMVALVQAATTFPMFALALPAGALADIVDRRRLLIAAQLFGLIGAAGLALITLAGFTTAWVLLVFTAVIAVGAAFSAPAFQAIVPELVQPKALQQAVALNSLGVNIARAIGPALGGVIIAASGPAAVFAVNALSVVGVIIVLVRWRRAAPERHLPAEHMVGAMRAGLRYAMRAPELQVVLIRSVGFFLFASGLWALLPIIARRDLGLGPAGYGGLLTFMGLGAISGAILMPRLRGRMGANARLGDGGAVARHRILVGFGDAVRRRAGVDRNDGVAQWRRAGDLARVDQGARARHLSSGVSGVDGDGVGAVGIGCLAHRRAFDLARCRSAARGRGCDPRMAVPVRSYQRTRSLTLGALADPARRRTSRT